MSDYTRDEIIRALKSRIHLDWISAMDGHPDIVGYGDAADAVLAQVLDKAARIEALEAALREIEWHEPKSPAAVVARAVLDKGRN